MTKTIITAEFIANRERELRDRRSQLQGKTSGGGRAAAAEALFLQRSAEEAESASLAIEREQQADILNIRTGALLRIDSALRKIASGQYGACEECDEPIGPKRLIAVPEAPLCRNCQQAEEQNANELRRGGAGIYARELEAMP